MDILAGFVLFLATYNYPAFVRLARRAREAPEADAGDAAESPAV